MANTSMMLGASIQDGNALGILGSAGKLLSEGFRNGFAGAAAMKRFRDSQNEYYAKDAESRRTQGEYYAGVMQEGGKVHNQSGLLLTGNFLKGSDTNPMPNAEIERGEYLQTPDGNTMEVIGKKHSEGGEQVTVPPNTKVISDYLKIGGKLAIYFKKNYNLNVSAGSTFATVLDKYKKKLGLTELLDEEAKIMKKIVDQDDVQFDSTRELNLQVLSKNVNDLQAQKGVLEQKFNSFVDFVFDKQEEMKPKDSEGKYQDGGEVQQGTSQGQEVAQTQNAANPQEQLLVMIQQFASMNNTTPDEVIKQIESLPEDQQQGALQQIISVVTSNTDNSSQGQQSVQPQTDSGNIEALIQQYAQMVGQDSNAIVDSLRQMSDDQLQQAVQQMTQTVQQAMAQQGANNNTQPPTSEPDVQTPNPEQVLSDNNQIKDDSANTTSVMRRGGIVKADWIKQKAEDLVEEGGSHREAMLLAESMWENKMSKQDGGGIVADPVTKGMLHADYTYGLPGVTQWVNSRMTDPNYKYTDIADIAKRFAYLRAQRGLDNTGIDKMDINQLGELAGEMQQYDLEHSPELAKDYSLNVGMTRNGLSLVTADSKYMDTLKKEDPKLYAKVQKSLEPDGTIKVGSFKDYSDSERAKLTEVVKQQPKVFQDKFINTNYFDNQAYFRGIDADKFYFTNQDEFNKFKADNKDKLIDGYYKTDKTGIYVKPILLKDKEFATPEERDNWLKDRKADGTYTKHFYDGEDIAYTPIVKGETSKTEEPQKTATGDLSAYQNKQVDYSMNMPMSVPDQSNLTPIYLPTTMRQVGSVQADRFFVTPDQNLQELSKQANVAADTLVSMNPYTSGAGLANLQAQTNNSINRAIAQSTLTNQQDARNVSNINEERINQRDAKNLTLAYKYEKEAIVGQDHFYDEWRNYINNRNRQNVVNWNLQNQQNMFNAINPNFKIGPNGEVYQTDEPLVIYDKNSNKVLVDPKTKKVITQTTTTKNSDGSTTTTKESKKKGGLIMNSDLRYLLKK
ncbi:MAG: hypothetical protein LBM02_10125 [Lachnospiraceae bacterium]|nr:hypothetical protein [Lachnospiraceae bacterium]